MSNNTGGPAFPDKRRITRAGYTSDEFEPVPGMTLRDYFAAKSVPLAFHLADTDNVGLAEIARAAYEFADAMLEARK